MKIKQHSDCSCEKHVDLLDRLANHIHTSSASISNIVNWLDLTDEEIDYIDSAIYILYEKQQLIFKKDD